MSISGSCLSERERERERERVKCGGMEENIGDMKIKNRVVVFLAEEL